MLQFSVHGTDRLIFQLQQLEFAAAIEILIIMEKYNLASFHSILQDKTLLFINHVKSFCPAALNNNDVNHVPDSGQLCLSADLATTRQ